MAVARLLLPVAGGDAFVARSAAPNGPCGDAPDEWERRVRHDARDVAAGLRADGLRAHLLDFLSEFPGDFGPAVAGAARDKLAEEEWPATAVASFPSAGS